MINTLVCHAWGVTRVWTRIDTHPDHDFGYVLQGMPFVLFEQRGRTREELEEFYKLVEEK